VAASADASKPSLLPLALEDLDLTSTAVPASTTTTEAPQYQYLQINKGCVHAHSISTHRGKSVLECMRVCDTMSSCVAFEYGVDYGGGAAGHLVVKECRLKTSTARSDCDGAKHDTDLYIKKAWTPTGLKMPLFCFAVMMAKGGERDLIEAQLHHGIGIFTCDHHTVLSSERVKLEGGGRVFYAESIGDMSCEYGGPYYLALNSDIFLRAWKRVFSDGTYLKADLTVKVDPDAVFIPSRLQRHLRFADPDAKVYYNNCDHGLHGPIEVVARGGMITMARGIQACERALRHEFSWAGEDVFLRHCLGYLDVDRVDDFRLLSETHCFDEDPVRDGCNSGKVSFHPFKEVDSYFKCFEEAIDTNT